MSRNATATVDRGAVSTLGRSRQRNTWIMLAIALGAALLLSIAGVVVSRDDVAISRGPAVTQDQPGYTGDWKDLHVGRTSTAPTYTGDWKDSLVGR